MTRIRRCTGKAPRAISSGLGHFEKSAVRIIFRLAGVSIMLGTIEFTRTPGGHFGG